jgi:large subunit ribosomal protein L21
MYAVVEVTGSQHRVQQGDRIKVGLMDAEPGQKITIDKVLLLSTGSETKVGAPSVGGARVEASVIGHGRHDKIIVFKFKRRKNYRRRNGHRQPYTELQIDSISA